MKTFISKYEIPFYSVLRIVAGFLFLWHGSQKLFDIPHTDNTMAPYIVYIAGPVEFFGGLLVMLGLLTRPAAFICSGEMAVAYWHVHGLHALLPIVNRGELAMLYCFLFLYIVARGPGRFSLDNLLRKKRG